MCTSNEFAAMRYQPVHTVTEVAKATLKEP